MCAYECCTYLCLKAACTYALLHMPSIACMYTMSMQPPHPLICLPSSSVHSHLSPLSPPTVERTDKASLLGGGGIDVDSKSASDRHRLLGVNDKIYVQNERILNAQRTVVETEEVRD